MSNGQNMDYFDPIIEAISEVLHWDTDASTVIDKEGV